MKNVVRCLTVALLVCIAPRLSASTNVIVIPKEDKRAGAVFFVDECLVRGLTNSITLVDLRKWATNTIQRFNREENEAAGALPNERRRNGVHTRDVPESINQIQSRIPSCRRAEPSKDLQALESYREMVSAYAKADNVSEEEIEKRLMTIVPNSSVARVFFQRSEQGLIEAITIQWYIYGVTVGAESFKDTTEPWYQREIEKGIYLWHGYK